MQLAVDFGNMCTVTTSLEALAEDFLPDYDIVAELLACASPNQVELSLDQLSDGNELIVSEIWSVTSTSGTQNYFASPFIIEVDAQELIAVQVVLIFGNGCQVIINEDIVIEDFGAVRERGIFVQPGSSGTFCYHCEHKKIK